MYCPYMFLYFIICIICHNHYIMFYYRYIVILYILWYVVLHYITVDFISLHGIPSPQVCFWWLRGSNFKPLEDAPR